MKRMMLVTCSVVIVLLVGIGLYLFPDTFSSRHQEVVSPRVSWELREGNVWMPTATPPACPEPLVLATPVDLKHVTAILYPGQPRGEAWKPHGAFRFNNQPNNKAIVTVPFDAQVIRGSHLFINGEDQYAFEFIAPCGIFYSFGHLLELTPKFQAMADTLPLVVGFAQQQFFDVTPPVAVTQGEPIATAVGYAKTHNVVVDWGVLDLRHKNGAILRPVWAGKYSQELDQYAVCWLDFLPVEDATYLRGLFGSGDVKTGTLSDYCHYPENI